MLYTDLIKTAQKLVQARGKPRQSDLLRASSTAYYVLFHVMARNCADMFIGSTKSNRSDPAWAQVYRSLDHNHAKIVCGQELIREFPNEIQDFANQFISMQTKRHKADYDPFYRISKSSVLTDLSQIEAVIQPFLRSCITDRRAFAAYVLLKKRK